MEPFASELYRRVSAAAICVSQRGPIKPLLLGQRLVPGLGNIYCDESLHRARSSSGAQSARCNC